MVDNIISFDSKKTPEERLRSDLSQEPNTTGFFLIKLVNDVDDVGTPFIGYEFHASEGLMVDQVILFCEKVKHDALFGSLGEYETYE